MIKHKITDVPNGDEIMKKEMGYFFDLLGAVIPQAQKTFPNDNINLRANKYLSGGYNFEIGKNSLVSQYDFPVLKSATDAFLSLAIYDLLFDNEGLSLNAQGMPERFDIDTHQLKYMQYELNLNEKGQAVWCELVSKKGEWSTSDLADKWINDFYSLVK